MNIFDFDWTIYQGDSTFDFWRYCLRRYPETRKRMPSAAWAAALYGLKRIGLEDFKARFYRFLQDVPDVDEAVEDFWLQGQDNLRMDVLGHSKDGDLVISASPEFLLRPICDKLDLKLIASQVDPRTGELLGPNCKGAQKVARIEEAGLPRAYEKAFSDSLSDTPIARLAREAYLVTRTGMRPFPFED